MWRSNNWNEVEATINNETIKIFPLKEVEKSLLFQISKKQTSELSFTIEAGRTFIEYNGNTYRIVQVLDYTHVRQIRLMQCKSVRI